MFFCGFASADELGVEVRDASSGVARVAESHGERSAFDFSFFHDEIGQRMEFLPRGGGDISNGRDMFFVNKEEMMLGSFVRIHIIRQDPVRAVLDDRALMISREICGTEGADTVFSDILDDVLVSVVGPEYGIAHIDKRF